MAMTKMQYKNFIFDINPSDIKLTLKKNLAKTNVMHSTQVCSEVGESVAVISGKGRFVGENAIKKAYELIRIYNKQGADFLFTPCCAHMLAVFNKLNISYSSDSKRVEYAFEFTQQGRRKAEKYDFGYTFANEGENLFDIAERTQISIEKIVELNDFCGVFSVKEGDKVWLM